MSSGAVQRALLVWAAALGACSSQAGSDGATGGQGSGTGLGDGGPVDVSGGVPGGMTGSGGGAVAGGSRTAEAGGTVAGGSRAAGGAGQGSSDAGMAGQGGAWDGAVGGETGGLDGAGDPCGPGNPAVVPLPVIGAGTFDITTYGAVGDGKTDNSKAIQAALTAAGAAGGGTVSVPAGTFLSGPVVLASGTRLDLASGATLMMLPMASYGAATPFITADHAHDIALTGSGTIDGQGQDWWTAFASDSSLSRPQEVSFSNSSRVQISGVRLQNSPEEHIWVKGDTDVTITGITIAALPVAGQAEPKNTDGVDMNASGVFFCNNSIADGDDNVVMEGANIYVAYSTFGVGHGCSIGSITENGVVGVTVDHITMNGTTSGIRMKSARDRGGLVQNLSYTNIAMSGVETPIDITSYYPTVPSSPTTDTAQAVTATTPYWKDITIENMTATGSTNGGVIWGLPEAKITDVSFVNVRIEAKTGMEIFHATGVAFTAGSTVTSASGAAVTIYDADVTGIATVAY